MNKKIEDQMMPIGKLIRVRDQLPPPEQLVLPSETVKITIALKKSSLEFFRRQAQKHHTKYQKMIRELVDRYATLYQPAQIVLK